MKLTTHLHLVTRLGMNTAIRPYIHMPSVVYRDNFTFHSSRAIRHITGFTDQGIKKVTEGPQNVGLSLQIDVAGHITSFYDSVALEALCHNY